MTERWINLVGAANVRDLGGLPAGDGATTRYGRVLRADNLQDLTADDIDHLVDKVGVRDVVDLRTTVEVTSEGPGPLTTVPTVTIHHLSVLPEAGEYTDVEAAETWLPRASDSWDATGLAYTYYLRRRPDSVVAALRTMATGSGATLAHCAAGKDRTGVICAMALSVAGVDREAIIDDYVQTGERLPAIIARLRATPTYGADLDGRSIDEHLPRAEAMHTFFAFLDTEFGGPLGWLRRQGWSTKDTDALRTRLLS